MWTRVWTAGHNKQNHHKGLGYSRWVPNFSSWTKSCKSNWITSLWFWVDNKQCFSAHYFCWSILVLKEIDMGVDSGVPNGSSFRIGTYMIPGASLTHVSMISMSRIKQHWLCTHPGVSKTPPPHKAPLSEGRNVSWPRPRLPPRKLW